MGFKFFLLSCILLKLSVCWTLPASTNIPFDVIQENDEEDYIYQLNNVDYNETAFPEDPFDENITESLVVTIEEFEMIFNNISESINHTQAEFDILKTRTYAGFEKIDSISNRYWKVGKELDDNLYRADLLQESLNFTISSLIDDMLLHDLDYSGFRNDLVLRFLILQNQINEKILVIKQILKLWESLIIDDTPTDNNLINAVDGIVEDLVKNEDDFDRLDLEKKVIYDYYHKIDTDSFGNNVENYDEDTNYEYDENNFNNTVFNIVTNSTENQDNSNFVEVYQAYNNLENYEDYYVNKNRGIGLSEYEMYPNDEDGNHADDNKSNWAIKGNFSNFSSDIRSLYLMIYGNSNNKRSNEGNINKTESKLDTETNENLTVNAET